MKNPDTILARQLQDAQWTDDVKKGEAALANTFDRLLFLTATPFQLGHHELLNVLRRFGDARWDNESFGDRQHFFDCLDELERALTDSQRGAIAFQRAWSKLLPSDAGNDLHRWWDASVSTSSTDLTPRVRAAVDAFNRARITRNHAEDLLRSWIIRYNKGTFWSGTPIERRNRVVGAAIVHPGAIGGILVPGQQLLPFFLAARSAAEPGKDLLGEALCSSYEAFRHTRRTNQPDVDDREDVTDRPESSRTSWYLREFDAALERKSGRVHPKVSATVSAVVDLWERGEKVLVFAYYRQTCRALRVHISKEIDRRLMETARRRLGVQSMSDYDLTRLLGSAQRRYFDDVKSGGKRLLDAEFQRIIDQRSADLARVRITGPQCAELIGVMRRFLRVKTTLVRSFPLAEIRSRDSAGVVAKMLDSEDASGMSWRTKLTGFIDFLIEQSTEAEAYLAAAKRTQTRGIRVSDDETANRQRQSTLANVQVITGETETDIRARLMRAFNTPFFPDILVCSKIMGEGVDLQRYCSHVVHHDLDWNPSDIEQRTGRVDRLGCKAEGRQPIGVYLPFLAGASDERQFRVMSDRERWFRVVMGQAEVARLITEESATLPLPEAVSDELSFRLAPETVDMSDDGRVATNSARPAATSHISARTNRSRQRSQSGMQASSSRQNADP